MKPQEPQVLLERSANCSRCFNYFVQKWVVAQKKWSQINSVDYWTNGKGWNDYKLLCRNCLKDWHDNYRPEFLSKIEVRKRKIFINYKNSGVFDKIDHLIKKNDK